MKLALLLLVGTLVSATPVPDADADAAPAPLPAADADAEAEPWAWHGHWGRVRPRPGACSGIYCIRAPCLQACCPNKTQYCPWGFSCYGEPARCCPPGWWCDAPGGPRNCHVEQC